MKEKESDGTFDILVLKALAPRPLHGLRESENNCRAMFYRFYKTGKKRLGAKTADWQRIAIVIASALKAT